MFISRINWCIGTEFKLYFHKVKNWALIQEQYKISMRNKEVASEAHTCSYVPLLEIFLTASEMEEYLLCFALCSLYILQGVRREQGIFRQTWSQFPELLPLSPTSLVKGHAGTGRLEEAWPEHTVLWLHSANRQFLGEPSACWNSSQAVLTCSCG